MGQAGSTMSTSEKGRTRTFMRGTNGKANEYLKKSFRKLLEACANNEVVHIHNISNEQLLDVRAINDLLNKLTNNKNLEEVKIGPTLLKLIPSILEYLENKPQVKISLTFIGETLELEQVEKIIAILHGKANIVSLDLSYVRLSFEAWKKITDCLAKNISLPSLVITGIYIIDPNVVELEKLLTELEKKTDPEIDSIEKAERERIENLQNILNKSLVLLTDALQDNTNLLDIEPFNALQVSLKCGNPFALLTDYLLVSPLAYSSEGRNLKKYPIQHTIDGIKFTLNFTESFDNSLAYVFCFSLDNKESFEKVKQCILMFESQFTPGAKIILAGMRSSVAPVITESDINQFKKPGGVSYDYMEYSATDKSSIENLFKATIEVKPANENNNNNNDTSEQTAVDSNIIDNIARALTRNIQEKRMDVNLETAEYFNSIAVKSGQRTITSAPSGATLLGTPTPTISLNSNVPPQSDNNNTISSSHSPRP